MYEPKRNEIEKKKKKRWIYVAKKAMAGTAAP